MINAANLDNFGKRVLDHYGFLVDEYQCLLTQKDDWTYIFENTTTRVIIMMERGVNLVVEIEPIGEGARSLLRQNILPTKLGVIPICMCLDKELKYKVERQYEKSRFVNVPVELEKQADLLRKYCQHILHGDFSEWVQIENCLSARSGEFLSLFWGQ